jgi:hypothetical protein
VNFLLSSPHKFLIQINSVSPLTALFFRVLDIQRKLLELYLYIVVSLIVRVLPAYFTPVHVLYIVAFGPSKIQVAYS